MSVWEGCKPRTPPPPLDPPLSYSCKVPHWGGFTHEPHACQLSTCNTSILTSCGLGEAHMYYAFCLNADRSTISSLSLIAGRSKDYDTAALVRSDNFQESSNFGLPNLMNTGTVNVQLRRLH